MLDLFKRYNVFNYNKLNITDILNYQEINLFQFFDLFKIKKIANHLSEDFLTSGVWQI